MAAARAASSVELRIPTARVFRPLLEPARYKGAKGGRGSAKSHFFAGGLVERAVTQPGLRAVCVREVQKTLKESAKRLIEDKVRAHDVGHLFRPLEAEIRTPGGGLIVFHGMTDHTAESIKSLEGYDIAWVEEAQTLSARSLELLRPTIRKAGSELWFSWNPRSADDPVDAFLCGPTPPPGAVVVHANYTDNPWFPAELEAERAHDERTNPDRYGHIWLGEYEPSVVGALWTRQMLHAGRREKAPTLGQIVVAVDPPASSEPGSDEAGIIVVGVGEECGEGYVIDDLSMPGAPRQWAERAIAAFDRHDADAVVVEVNQGGEMVKHTLHSVRPGLPVVEVRATRGKHVRAEPIAALYALGRVHHVGTFARLEDQMCVMTPAGYEGKGSPDRLDAAVWALAHLFPSMTTRPSPPPRASEAETLAHVSGGWMA